MQSYHDILSLRCLAQCCIVEPTPVYDGSSQHEFCYLLTDRLTSRVTECNSVLAWNAVRQRQHTPMIHGTDERSATRKSTTQSCPWVQFL